MVGRRVRRPQGSSAATGANEDGDAEAVEGAHDDTAERMAREQGGEGDDEEALEMPGLATGGEGDYYDDGRAKSADNPGHLATVASSAEAAAAGGADGSDSSEPYAVVHQWGVEEVVAWLQSPEIGLAEHAARGVRASDAVGCYADALCNAVASVRDHAAWSSSFASQNPRCPCRCRPVPS